MKALEARKIASDYNIKKAKSWFDWVMRKVLNVASKGGTAFEFKLYPTLASILKPMLDAEEFNCTINSIKIYEDYGYSYTSDKVMISLRW